MAVGLLTIEAENGEKNRGFVNNLTLILVTFTRIFATK